jgi:hypothetical protein
VETKSLIDLANAGEHRRFWNAIRQMRVTIARVLFRQSRAQSAQQSSLGRKITRDAFRIDNIPRR